MTNMTLEKGVLFFEDGTEVSNVSIGLLKAAPELLKAAEDFIALFRDSDMRPEDECHDLFSTFLSAVEDANKQSR
jgi:hypothetical protein